MSNNMSADIYAENYNDFSIVVRGNTKVHKEKLKEIGGRWNPNLNGGPGWIFSKRLHSQQLVNYISQLDVQEPDPEEKSQELVETLVDLPPEVIINSKEYRKLKQRYKLVLTLALFILTSWIFISLI